MKVLLVNYEYPGVTENCGGGGRVTELLKRGLGELGHTVVVVTDREDGSHLTFPIRTYRRLQSAIRDFQPDVVNAHFSIPTGLPLARICRKRGIPLVTSIMGADLYDPTRYGRIRPVLNRVNSYVFRRSDAIVTPSTDMGKRVPARYQCRARVIRYGIDPESWSWQPKKLTEPIQIVTVCRLVDRKNLTTAIETVTQLQAEGYCVEYTIVGKGPLAETLEQRYGHHDWLSLPGYVADLQATFDQSHIFFLPSKHEAFGMVFLEALASGLPVVTSRTGGQTDIVDYAVGLADGATLNEFALTLKNVIERYPEVQRNTEGYVQRNFDYLQMAQDYAELYGELA